MANIVFLQKQTEELLGPMYLSAMLKSHGHHCEIYVEPLEKSCIVEKALSSPNSPDIIAFSCLSTDFHWALRKAEMVKKASDVLTLLGGTQITLNPEAAIRNPHVDVLCRGEGEHPILELAEAVDAKGDFSHIPNLWVKNSKAILRNDLRDLIEDLDGLPFPDRSLYRKYPRFDTYACRPIHIGRGCPFNCSYCHNEAKRHIFSGKGTYVRCRSVDNVIDEIEHLKNTCQPRVLHFVDDSFGSDRRWTADFLEKLREQKGRKPILYANTRADLVNETLCQAFTRYGSHLFRIRIALECADPHVRQSLLNKKLSNKDLYRCADLFHRHKIPFVTYNMVGLPGEGPEKDLDTLKMNIQIKPTSALCFVFQPFLGTQLAEHVINKGYASREEIEESGKGDYQGYYDSRSLLHQPGIRQSENIHRIFSLAVCCPCLYPLLSRATAFEKLSFLFDRLYGLFRRAFLWRRKRTDGF